MRGGVEGREGDDKNAKISQETNKAIIRFSFGKIVYSFFLPFRSSLCSGLWITEKEAWCT